MKRTIAGILMMLLVMSFLSSLTVSAAESPAQWLWADEGAFTGDYAFSLAVVGDTQTMCYNGAKGSSAMPGMYQWIVDNVEAKKIQYVVGLGDITEKGEDWGHKNNDTEAETAVGDREWEYAKSCIAKMNGAVPYTLIRGAGHDGLDRFNEWFADYTPYTENIAGYMTEGDIGNVYHTFEANGTKYLILCLDFGTKDPAIEWAASVIDAHADHKVIVTTHAYLEKDGTLLETGEDYCPSQSYYDPTNNDGDDLWEGLIRKHENIFMVICGHMTCDDAVIKQVQGDAGNTVTQILIDPQGIDGQIAGGYGMVAMLYFDANGKDVALEYYSTARNIYRPLKKIDLEHVHAYTAEVIEPGCRTAGKTVHTCDCGDSYTTDFKNPIGQHVYDDEYDAICERCGYKRRVPKNPNAEEESKGNDGGAAKENAGGGCASSSASETATPLLFGGGAAALCVNFRRRKRKK